MPEQINDFAKVLRRHDGTDYCNAKILATAGGYDSNRSGYNLLSEGLSFYPWFKTFLKRLQKDGGAPLVLDLLKDLAEDLPVTVAPTEGSEKRPPLEQSAVVMQIFANVNRAMFAALRDNLLCPREESELMPMLHEAQRELAGLEKEVLARRTMRMSAG